MFRTEAQQAMVCETLCRIAGLPGMWTAHGPTARALLLRRRNPFSHGEKLMFKAAWDVWGGYGKMRLDEALHTLDSKNLNALGSLLIAFGDPRGGLAIDEWLRRWSGFLEQRGA